MLNRYFASSKDGRPLTSGASLTAEPVLQWRGYTGLLARLGGLEGEPPRFSLSVTRRVRLVVKDHAEDGASQTRSSQHGGVLGDMISVCSLTPSGRAGVGAVDNGRRGERERKRPDPMIAVDLLCRP